MQLPSAIPASPMDGLIPLDDGGVLIPSMEDDSSQQQQFDINNHDQNLAIVLSEEELSQIGAELIAAVEDDIASQELYYDGVAKVINLLGVQLMQSGDKDDLPFKGATQVYSMALFETATDILSTATSSLFPSTGMVDSVVVGEATPEFNDIAYRKKAYFNNYLTQVAKEFKKESIRTLYWAILAGSCYKKVFIDPVLGRPTSMFIRPDDFIVNKNYATHQTANRKTQFLHFDRRELLIRKQKGIYRDVDITSRRSYTSESTEIQEQLNENSGRTDQYDDSHTDVYDIYECHVNYIIENDPLAPTFAPSRPGMEADQLPMPYVISIDSQSGTVLSIYRNWKKDDILQTKREYFVNYSFLPSLDGEGYGLINYAGRAAEAATSITRQLINTATYSNFPGGVYDSSIRIENNNLRPAPGEFVPLQTGGRDIETVVMALPYKEPSPALKELLTDIENTIKKPSAIISDKIMDMAPRAPMGTVLAMLETMQRVPNAIIENFHISFGEELKLFNERFAEWMPDDQPYPFKVPGGNLVIMKQDFMNDITVIPASDPSLHNTNYRFLQSEIILNQAKEGAEYHNIRYAYEYFYKAMGLSPEDIQQLLLPPPQANPPQPLDLITENQNLLTGKPVVAGIMQDHDAHIIGHSLVSQDPSSPPPVQQASLAHIQEHKALKMLVQMQGQLGFEMPQDPSQIPMEMQNQISVAAAQIAQQELEAMQAAQHPQQQAIDPSIVGLKEIEMQTENAARKDALQEQKQLQDFQIEQERLLQAREETILKNELEAQKMELEVKKMENDLLTKERDLLLREHELMIKSHENHMKVLQDETKEHEKSTEE
jgi:hypothetical protein